MTTNDEVRELGQRWAEAEQRGDDAALADLAADDFTLVGPLGFMLNREQWTHRYDQGGLVTHALTWDDYTIREYGDVAVAVGVVTQKAEFNGQPADGRFRVTQISVRQGGRRLLAGLHYSPIAAPPGA
ncbi:MAG: nuclear transport factor 2 family protein [Nonomuraea sp.]|nr:nuclear transport factor 2 family protein [Nonomuraea sp.]